MDSNLKKQFTQLKRINMLLIALLVLISGYLLIEKFSTSNQTDVLYAKGLVILDDEGNERILIGAPIPKSKDRIRDDLKKAQAVWGEELELNKEWDWFEDMSHDCFGMLILDEKGHDRLAIGSPTPDPNIGLRIGPATGIEINDENGYERSGYSYMPVNGGSRVVLGLDRPGSSEGATFSILEDGTTGLSVYDNKSKSAMFLGNSEANTYMTPGKEKYFGLAVKDSLDNIRIMNSTNN